MSKADTVIQSQTATFSNAVQSIIGRTCLIEFGVVKKVLAPGVVQVAVSVAKNIADVRILTCILLQPSSSALMLNIQPAVDDKVLVFSPRRFDGEMFDLTKNDFIVNEDSNGFTPFSCVAILCNQFRTNDYKNYIKVSAQGVIELHACDGEVSFTTAYDAEKKSITLTDGNSNSIAMSSSGTVINGKLTVKHG